MTKEEYIILREEEVVSPLLFFIYYLDHKVLGDPELQYAEFKKHFEKFITNVMTNNIIQTKLGIRHLNYEVMLQKVYAYLNKKFE